jgi:hypothetical protein
MKLIVQEIRKIIAKIKYMNYPGIVRYAALPIFIKNLNCEFHANS